MTISLSFFSDTVLDVANIVHSSLLNWSLVLVKWYSSQHYVIILLNVNWTLQVVCTNIHLDGMGVTDDSKQFFPHQISFWLLLFLYWLRYLHDNTDIPLSYYNYFGYLILHLYMSICDFIFPFNFTILARFLSHGNYGIWGSWFSDAQ